MLKKSKLISIAILIGFVILIYILLKSRAYDLKNVLQVDLKYVVLLCFLVALRPLLKGLRIKILTQRYGLNLVFKEWFGLTILTTFGNYLSPFRAGGTAMAVYLKKKYQFPYTYSVSLTGTLYLTQFFIYGLLGFFLTVFIPFPKNIKTGVILFFILIFLISIVMLFFIPLPIKTDKKLLKYLTNAISEFRRVRNFNFMIKSIVIDILRVIAEATALYFAFKAFNFTAPFTACMLMSVLSQLSLIISLTPMGLGVQESIIIITSKLIGVDVLTGAFVAALNRAIPILNLIILVPLFSYLLLKRKKTRMDNS